MAKTLTRFPRSWCYQRCVWTGVEPATNRSTICRSTTELPDCRRPFRTQVRNSGGKAGPAAPSASGLSGVNACLQSTSARSRTPYGSFGGCLRTQEHTRVGSLRSWVLTISVSCPHGLSKRRGNCAKVRPAYKIFLWARLGCEPHCSLYSDEYRSGHGAIRSTRKQRDQTPPTRIRKVRKVQPEPRASASVSSHKATPYRT